MKLPPALIGALAAALAAVGTSGCSDLGSVLPKPKAGPKSISNTPTDGNVDPNACPPDGGNRHKGDDCPPCGRG